METKVFKRLPYGISDFKRIINENYAYVDKTRYIEMLENETNPSQF
ncbi:MAG: AAA family ATPase, partial [Tannerella sp.]|nr:AAA family ATPase [Tannerella sp.]